MAWEQPHTNLGHLKLKKIQGLFKEKWNSRTFQGLPLEFKDFQNPVDL